MINSESGMKRDGRQKIRPRGLYSIDLIIVESKYHFTLPLIDQRNTTCVLHGDRLMVTPWCTKCIWRLHMNLKALFETTGVF